MSEDDAGGDWFERAVSGDDAEEDPEHEEPADATHGDAADATDGPDDEAADPEGDDDLEGDGDPEGDGDAGASSPFEDVEGESLMESPFEDVEGEAAEESPMEGVDSEADADGPFDEDPFGEGADGEALFEDDFTSAFESAPGPGGETEFDDEDFESDIPRIDLGIDGLDAMIQGGVPERHLVVVIGAAGTGKTTFGLQFLDHGLSQGENAVFITLEQSREAILATANEHDWPFEEHEEEGRLAVIDLDPIEMANSLDNIRGELPDLVERFDADRLVLDSVSLLEMMYDDQARRRTEVFDFTRSLKAAGVTTMLTSEASESNPFASRHGIIEYLTDAVFVLRYVRSEGPGTRLAVEIQKIRNANHSRETKPYEITSGEITVYQQANIF